MGANLCPQSSESRIISPQSCFKGKSVSARVRKNNKISTRRERGRQRDVDGVDDEKSRSFSGWFSSCVFVCVRLCLCASPCARCYHSCKQTRTIRKLRVVSRHRRRRRRYCCCCCCSARMAARDSHTQFEHDRHDTPLAGELFANFKDSIAFGKRETS